MKILSLSDRTIPFIYSPQARARFGKVDLVLGCGDLAYAYLEYVLTVLDTSLFYVRGNHDNKMEYGSAGGRRGPHGGTDLHLRICRQKGLLLAGVEGSLRYRDGEYQYTQGEMWGHVFRLVPGLVFNRLRHGRYLDVFVTHAPPEGIHDQPDLPHQGIEAFRWLIRVFQPAFHFHGHVHVYHPDATVETRVGRTRVINTYGYRETEFDLSDL